MAETSQAPKDLIGFLDYYLVQKAPFQIPQNGRELIVKIAPWIILVLLLLSIGPILVLLGLGTVLVPFGGVAYASGFGIAALFLIGYCVLMVAALPGLFRRKRQGWTLAFYAELLSIVSSLASGSIVGAIIGGLIGLYLLFQVRTLYS